MNCQHKWEVVREPHKAIREFVVELRCCQCEARKFVEEAPKTDGIVVTIPGSWRDFAIGKTTETPILHFKYVPDQRETDDSRKFAAQMLLIGDGTHRIVIPTRDEWIGVNLLERDDGLKRNLQ